MLSVEAVKFELTDKVALITLNKPQTMNALDDELQTELKGLVVQIQL